MSPSPSPLIRGISHHDSPIHGIHRLIDGLILVGCLAWALRFTPGILSHQFLSVAASAILIHLVAAELSGLYRSWRGAGLRREIACILLTWAYTLTALLGLGMFTTFNSQVTYLSKLSWILVTPLVLIGTRVAMRTVQRHLRARGFNTRRVAICGVNSLGLQLAHNLRQSPEFGLGLTGFYDDRPEQRIDPIPSGLGDLKGNLDQLVAAARRGEVDIIYITFPMRAEQRIRQILHQLGDTTASVYIVPDFFVFELLHARWSNISGLPVVSVFENPLFGVNGLFKRATDLVMATLLLIIAALPMAVIAVAIKLSSPGPVFFRQRRYGLDGREIRVWKFRSMTCCDNGPVVRQATRDDQRITPIGAILRRTSLDELPQLFNVIAGSMSLVGPRPHATAHNEQYRALIDGYMLRHKVKPGITGLAQVMGCRGETETLEKMEQRVKYDHQYIRDWSLWMDLKILLRTMRVVLNQEGAH